jgi:hypothetical protein
MLMNMPTTMTCIAFMHLLLHSQSFGTIFLGGFIMDTFPGSDPTAVVGVDQNKTVSGNINQAEHHFADEDDMNIGQAPVKMVVV